MAALPFCFIYPQSEGRESFGPRFVLGDRLRNIASPYSCLRETVKNDCLFKGKQKSAGFMAAAHKSLRQMIISREFLRGGSVLLSAEKHPGARIF